jgi:hypothetical protein
MNKKKFTISILKKLWNEKYLVDIKTCKITINIKWNVRNEGKNKIILSLLLS